MVDTLILTVSLVFFVMAAVQVPPLMRKGRWRELASFWGIWIIAYTMSLLQVMGVKLPNPTKGIEVLMSPITRLLDRLLAS